MKKFFTLLFFSIIIFLTACLPDNQTDLTINNINMKLISPAFEHTQNIPAKYTCDGENINPPLSIDALPLEAKSLVLIIDDPDAPAGDWVHWLVWNIDPRLSVINENSVPQDAVQGTNSFNKTGYDGPCPPGGTTHRYFFKLYALDTSLQLDSQADKSLLEQTIKNHIIDSAELIGTYQKNKY